MKRTSHKRVVADQMSTESQDLTRSNLPENDIARVRGQYHVKRALEVAAAGGHSILLVGSPGAGKAVLCRTFPTLLPDREDTYPLYQPQPEDEELCVPDSGILFLRDIQRFKTSTLTRFWQARSEMPKALQLLASSQPCPCGFFGDPVVACQCRVQLIARYQRRLVPFLTSGFDIHVEVPAPHPEHLLDARGGGECSEVVRGRVEEAREWQRRRFVGQEIVLNAAALTQLDNAQQAAHLDGVGKKLLEAAMRQLHLTPQALIQTLRLARTVADLAGAETVTSPHLAEAIQYRPRIRG